MGVTVWCILRVCCLNGRHCVVYSKGVFLQEEWKLLFLHVLHFPVMVKEICDIGAGGANIRIETKLKKVPLTVCVIS